MARKETCQISGRSERRVQILCTCMCVVTRTTARAAQTDTSSLSDVAVRDEPSAVRIQSAYRNASATHTDALRCH